MIQYENENILQMINFLLHNKISEEFIISTLLNIDKDIVKKLMIKYKSKF